MKAQRLCSAVYYAVSFVTVSIIGFHISSSAADDTSTSGTTSRLDAKAIAEASGTKTTIQKDGVVKIGWSRTDVSVTIDGERFPPAAGLGSWAAFSPMSKGAMVMGDTVVFEDEVDAAMDAAFSHGLNVTALHNHFFYSKPPVFFMHIAGEGDAVALARGVRAVWNAIHEVRKKRPHPATHFSGGQIKRGQINGKDIEKVIGEPVNNNNGVLKVVVGRTASINGATIGGSMGVSTWAAFVGSDKLASMDGDFVMTEKESQDIFRSLRKANIHIVAIHTHMMGETPTMYFMHFWGKGSAVKLAKAFKDALDAQAMADRT